MKLTFHEGELDRPEVQALLRRHVLAMRSCSPADACHVLDDAGLRGADVRFFSAREAGRLVGIGALKPLSPDHGEIKSMHTAPEALGRGVGARLLNHLLEQARAEGMRRVSLETGSGAAFAAADRLYRKAGFVPAEAFGGYREGPFTRFFSRAL